MFKMENPKPHTRKARLVVLYDQIDELEGRWGCEDYWFSHTVMFNSLMKASVLRKLYSEIFEIIANFDIWITKFDLKVTSVTRSKYHNFSLIIINVKIPLFRIIVKYIKIVLEIFGVSS